MGSNNSALDARLRTEVEEVPVGDGENGLGQYLLGTEKAKVQAFDSLGHTGRDLGFGRCVVAVCCLHCGSIKRLALSEVEH